MARNKYVKDYRLLETMDERGRMHVDYEYIGEYYVFAAGGRAAAREKRILLALCAAAWAAFVGALLLPSEGMRAFFVSLPFAFAALPLGMLTSAVISIPSGEKTMEHRTADKLENSYPVRALFTAVLPGASLAGQAIRLLARRSGLWPGDAVFTLGAAALTVLGAVLFSRRKNLAVRPAGQKK